MREIKSINKDWKFQFKNDDVDGQISPEWVHVDLPHTWNKYDGQDGGNDYKRGLTVYEKKVDFGELKPGSQIFMRVNAAADIATVLVNGKKAAYHEGGYSIFTFNITDLIHAGENDIEIQVDSSFNDRIYPQTADFTFYGGLYRGVDIIIVPKTHFDLEYKGSNGFTVRSYPDVEKKEAKFVFNAWIKNPEKGDFVSFKLVDAEGNQVAFVEKQAEEHVQAEVELKNVHLWQGTVDPYLYTAYATLRRHNEVLDEVDVRHGVREMVFDPQKGFFLNGVLTPLRGVSRHQDLLDEGNALTYEEHKRDADLIKEIGANTVRLAHYQHSQDFYDLMDEYGFIVWAEIPFISKMSQNKEAHQNARSQMEELIIQNYNHPSIGTWGISNEITIGGEYEELNENLRDLNKLAHELDDSRVTTMAQVTMLPMDSVQNDITDILSYNHYFGWYGGELEDNEKWFDTFHAMHPDRSLGISEYGCEGIIDYHNDQPARGDYSEEYQAKYHEHMAKIINERPWLWGTHVWNMFDFAADARDEGGVKGRNNKGLVTFDRNIKKDSFYLYKAYWSDEPFVHINGKRYAKRAQDETEIKVYSNQPEVVLIDEEGKKTPMKSDKVFVFENVPLHEGVNEFKVQAGDLEDTILIEKVEEEPEEYSAPKVEIVNWFLDKEEGNLDNKEGYYSIYVPLKEFEKDQNALDTFAQAMATMTGNTSIAMALEMMGNRSIEELTKFAGDEPDMKLLGILNAELQKIKIPE